MWILIFPLIESNFKINFIFQSIHSVCSFFYLFFLKRKMIVTKMAQDVRMVHVWTHYAIVTMVMVVVIVKFQVSLLFLLRSFISN